MKKITLFTTVFGVACLLGQCVSAAPIGIQVLIQTWDPRNPDAQNVRVSYDSSSAVSDVVTNAWNQVRDVVCGPLKQHMGGPDLLIKGVTLYDMDCKLPPRAELITTQQGGRVLKLVYRAKAVAFAATSTTPGFAPGIGTYSTADPRFSVSFDLDFELGLSVRGNGGAVRVYPVRIVASNARMDSLNAPDNILKWFNAHLLPLITGKSFPSHVETALNGINLHFANRANAELVPLNNTLRPPHNLIPSGLWARPEKIYIAFAPAEWIPPANSRVRGRVSWKNGDNHGSVDSCAALAVRAYVRTGPAPLVDPITRAKGSAPTRKVGHLVSVSPVISKGGNQGCGYTLGAIPGGVPVVISTSVPRSLKPGYGSKTSFKGTTP